jgi:hypothetical protein
MKGNATMKKLFLFLSLFIVVSLACDLAVTVAPTGPAPLPTNTVVPDLPTQVPTSVDSIPTTEAPVPATEAPTMQPPSVTGTAVSYGPLSLVIPAGVASGFSGSQFPRADGQDLPYWELTPGHSVLKLEGYLLQGKFHQPQIYVFPALDYAVLVPGAFESMHRLRNVMYAPSASISADQLPAVPFFNAAQVFASNVQPISFQNGSGMRFLTEYAQYAASVNNQDLFYHFQGFSDDGEYYILAIFPITAPVLAETSDAGAVLPSGGIAYPDANNPNADFPGYYASVAALLNATSPGAFTPTIDQLDALIQSIQIAP